MLQKEGCNCKKKKPIKRFRIYKSNNSMSTPSGYFNIAYLRTGLQYNVCSPIPAYR